MRACRGAGLARSWGLIGFSMLGNNKILERVRQYLASKSMTLNLTERTYQNSTQNWIKLPPNPPPIAISTCCNLIQAKKSVSKLPKPVRTSQSFCGCSQVRSSRKSWWKFKTSKMALGKMQKALSKWDIVNSLTVISSGLILNRRRIPNLDWSLTGLGWELPCCLTLSANRS